MIRSTLTVSVAPSGMPYMPALDGMRAVAALLVFAFHTHGLLAPGGFLGVDIFFVLSGFLITTLMLKAPISIGAFYMRRARRLLPALIVFISCYLAAAPLLWPAHDHGRDALMALLYISDYTRAFWGNPQYISHTWSLSVEEHYYLVWPLVIAMARRRSLRHIGYAICIAYVAATAWRVLCDAPWEEVYHRTDTRMSGLLLGSGLAVLLQLRPQLKISRRWIIAAVISAGVFFAVAGWHGSAALTLGVSAVELATAAIIINLRFADNVPQTLVYLGKISYGFYLWHFPILFYLRPLFGWEMTFLIGLPMTIVMAAASYEFVEKPVMRANRPGIEAA